MFITSFMTCYNYIKGNISTRVICKQNLVPSKIVCWLIDDQGFMIMDINANL
jgi:hypothetical protein